MAEDCSHQVFILGAGFSRALSPHMPLTDELGNLCLEATSIGSDPGIPKDGFNGGSFETWLSRLADEQPYLSTEENLDNQALFLRFSSEIANRLGQRVDETLREGWPPWLPEFLRLCHQHQSTLITFNYDSLVECAVNTGLLHDLGSSAPVYWAEVIGDVPNWPPGSMRIAADDATTFRLLKLHGSLNWYWSANDATGVSMARRDLPGAYGRPEPYHETERRRELPGRSPFVVPPSATKSPYFRNPVVREVWQQARSALRKAASVTIMGYSLPPSDLTFAGMFIDSLRDSGAAISVVDVYPDVVGARLLELGLPKSRIVARDSRGQHSPVATYVEEWRDQTARHVVDRLETEFDDWSGKPAIVAWGPNAAAAVVSSRIEGSDLVLEVDSWGTIYKATESRQGRTAPRVKKVRQLLQGRPQDTRLVIETPGYRHVIIDASRTSVGHGAENFVVLTPSGQAPSIENGTPGMGPVPFV